MNDPRVSCVRKAEYYCTSYPAKCCHCEHNLNFWHYFGWLSEILDTNSPTIEEAEKYWEQYQPMKEVRHYV